MPQIDRSTEIPDTLRPYIFHGIDLQWTTASKDAFGTCPFCGREGKFSVLIKTGQWRCLICNEGEDKGKAIKGGNAVVFVRKLHELGITMAPSLKDYSLLALERGILDSKHFKDWQLVKSPVTGEWVIPGFGIDGKMNNLYRYAKIGSKCFWHSGPKPSFHHQIHGLNLWDKSKPKVIVCEGPWDAIALYEVMKQTKTGDDGKFTVTGSVMHSLYNDTNIIALPGCNVFNEKWLPLFEGKDVTVMFDNDHPRKNEKTGQVIPPAGLSGTQRLCEILSGSTTPPSSISYLKWGENGYDESLKSGTDLRDVLKAAGKALGARINALGEILAKVCPAESAWLKGPSGGSGDAADESQLKPEFCDNFKSLITSWRKAMKWTDGLEDALTTMLACVVSTKAAGDQLWVKIIGPPSCGKTTLCEAISVNRKYVFPKDTMTGLFSGYVSQKNSGENLSMAEQIDGKTLTIKDADTILQNPAIGQILSQFRAFYDRSVRTQFKNEMSKDYENVSTTVILCGTSALKTIDSSELGERFLDCVIMEGIPDELEDEILQRVAHRVARTISLETGSTSNHQEPLMINAMKLTGGYVGFLRENASELFSQISPTDEDLFLLTRFGKFVAFMRARPSDRQGEIAEREFAARLVSQLIRYAYCAAVVTNKKSFDEEVIMRTRKRALDTARGKTMEIARMLFVTEETGMEVSSMSLLLGETISEVKKMLSFMRKIGIVEVYNRQAARGLKGKPAWRLTERMYRLWKQVHQLE